MIRSQLSASVWAVSIVLMDAYLHILFHLLSRSFSGFFSSWAGPSNSRSCPSASRFFLGCSLGWWPLLYIVGHLRQLGLRLFYYLDVWLLVAESRDLLEFSSPYDPAVVSGPWVPSELGKVFPSLHRDFRFFSWGSFWHPKVVGSAFRAQSFGSSGVFQDLFKGPLAPALFWQKFFGHLAGFVDLVLYCRLLMRPLQLHLLRDFTPLIDSQDLLVPLSLDFQGVVRGVVLSFSPSRREAFCYSSPFVGHHHGRVRSGVGGQFFTLTVFQGFGRRRRFLIISILWN